MEEDDTDDLHTLAKSPLWDSRDFPATVTLEPRELEAQNLGCADAPALKSCHVRKDHPMRKSYPVSQQPKILGVPTHLHSH